MNFLAHIYLSNNLKNVAIGNFIADGIRGKQYLKYSKEIQIGILLHREIDTFTDAHPIFRQSTKKLHKNYGHYSGIIVDIFYDHFLAKNWTTYSKIPLAIFVQDFYQLLEENFHILPQKTQHMVPFMMQHNWLLNYAHVQGIQQVLNGMNKRTGYKSNMHLATTELLEHYSKFELEFTSFFEELRIFAAQALTRLLANYSFK
ncbi:ACP phosphodiesterase [Bizionia sediminis]|uniref:ACP phosphodiesterase n=1 Tax=Bizionia sediminis TaxID=1737064 RepID=A0ABW5KV82_9FLAO